MMKKRTSSLLENSISVVRSWPIEACVHLFTLWWKINGLWSQNDLAKLHTVITRICSGFRCSLEIRLDTSPHLSLVSTTMFGWNSRLNCKNWKYMVCKCVVPIFVAITVIVTVTDLRELLQIKLLNNRCKWMETIIVSWQNGIRFRFSVKLKLSLHMRFPSKLSWNEYIVSNWRYRCNTIAKPMQYHCKIVFKAFLPKHFATRFYPLQTIVSLQVDFLYRFESISLQVDHFCTVSKAL
jgi:hypothetical protein